MGAVCFFLGTRAGSTHSRVWTAVINACSFFAVALSSSSILRSRFDPGLFSRYSPPRAAYKESERLSSAERLMYPKA